MSTFNVNSIKNDVTDAGDKGPAKTNGKFVVHYQTSSGQNNSLEYGRFSPNLGAMDSLQIWAERNGNDKKSKITLSDSSGFSTTLNGKRWTLTYEPQSIPGLSRPQGDDPKNIQVVVGSDGQ